MRHWRIAAAALALFALAGCEAVPRSGPTAAAVAASAAPPDAAPGDAASYALAVLDLPTIEKLEARRAAPPGRLESRAGARGHVIRTGDVVSVTIWEAVAGGIFSAGVAEAPGRTTLPPQRIGASGMLTVPYAGRIRAAGRTPEEVSAAVVAALAGKAIEPQALVTVSASPGSSVTVIGDAVGAGGRVPLTGTGERVLDVIAAAGGVSIPPHQALVRLARAGRVGETHLARILREPDQNVPVRPGDVVTVLASPATYTVFGAAERPARVPFPSEALMLDEALAGVGGIDDQRGEPAAVYVFRYEEEDVAEAVIGKDLPGPMTPIVYNLDLSDPRGFFLARRFAMRDKDILFLANADFADTLKVLRAINLLVTPFTDTLRVVQ